MNGNMIDTVNAGVDYCLLYPKNDSANDRVVNAIQMIDRDEFVPDLYKHHVYNNGFIPIGYDQSIPPPFIVELMTKLADTASDKVVLQIGTGTGYQSAILALLVKNVYTIEANPALAKASKNTLRKMGFNNIEVKCGDGYYGWKEKSPFDAIIVSVAVPHIPQNLIEQIKPGGHIVIPVGEPHSQQNLLLVTKDRKGRVNTEKILPVTFVSLEPNNVEITYL